MEREPFWFSFEKAPPRPLSGLLGAPVLPPCLWAGGAVAALQTYPLVPQEVISAVVSTPYGLLRLSLSLSWG